MKRYTLHIIALVIACGISGSMWGADINGNIGPQTISANTTWNLTGNVNITGQVTIKDGFTLTIVGNGKTITAFTGDGNAARTSFEVEGGGTLNISNAIVTGGNTGTIGGNVGEDDVKKYPGFTKSGRFISLNNTAKVYLTKVTAQNLYSINKDVVPFVQLSGTENGTSKTNKGLLKMEECTVKHCLNRVDNGIIHQSGGYMHADIDIDNCIITNCVILANNTGTGYGGVIKGAGSTACYLTMDNSTMQYCWSSGWGGAVLWAASGGGCKAVFKNCTFQYNYARYLGGAISSESTVELEGCTLKYNKAGYGGGALAAFPFTLTQTAGVVDNSTAIGLKLENNIIEYNKTLFSTNYNGDNVPTNIRAKESDGTEQGVYLQLDGYFNPRYTLLNATDIYYPTGGGGIWVLMNKDEWNCNLNIGSNQINNNESANNAGGVLLYKQTPYRQAKSGEHDYVANAERAHILGDYSLVDGKQTGITTMTISAQVYENSAKNSGGGIAIGASNNKSDTWTYPDVTVSGGYINNNTAQNLHGGGLYMPGGNFTINGNTEISGNKVLNNNGGGAYVAKGTLKVMDGFTLTVNGNEAINGGAIYLAEGDINVLGEIKAGNSSNVNKASLNGGAIYLAKGNFSITGSAIMDSNTSEGSGGSVYMESGNFSIKNGSFLNNIAKGTVDNQGDGGAIYLSEGNFTITGTVAMNGNQSYEGNGGAIYMGGGSFTIKNGSIANIGSNGLSNTAKYNGGGIYCKGSFTVETGAKATISYNSAKNGGALCVEEGKVELPAGENCQIMNNVAIEGNGGGLYVSGSQPASFSGGLFLKNKAKAGGGVFASGDIELFLASDVKENEAVIGGGIYLEGGVDMEFGDGLIVANSAISEEQTNATAYLMNKDSQKLYGAGGGIFIADGIDTTNPSKLWFSSSEKLGIYNNNATHAGADICANGNNTMIVLPNPKLMDLKNFDTIGNELYWVEDYMTGDSEYDRGLKIGTSGIRYVDALLDTELPISRMIYDNNQNVVDITQYACLDLGYDLVFVNLQVINLDKEGYAAIRISYKDGDTNDKIAYQNVLFYGKDKNTPVTLVIGLPSGDWNFKATDWMTVKYEEPTSNPTHLLNGSDNKEGFINIKREGLNGSTDKETTITLTFKELEEKLVIEAHKRVVNYMKLND